MSKVRLKQLTLATLAEVDPRIEALFQKHLKTLADDCMNRPGEKSVRKLTLEFALTPQLDESGDCDDVLLEVECKSKVPTFHTKSFPMRVSRAGLSFNADDPESVDQTTMQFEKE